MTQEEFEKQYNKPVDLDKVHEALGRFINGKGKLSIPASPDDDDMLICRLMNELKKYRGFRKPENSNIAQFHLQSKEYQESSVEAMND